MKRIALIFLLMAGCAVHHDCYHYDTTLETQRCFARAIKRDPCLRVSEPVAQQICYQTAQQHHDLEMYMVMSQGFRN